MPEAAVAADAARGFGADTAQGFGADIVGHEGDAGKVHAIS